MTDFLAALGLVLAIEGILLAAFPARHQTRHGRRLWRRRTPGYGLPGWFPR